MHCYDQVAHGQSYVQFETISMLAPADAIDGSKKDFLALQQKGRIEPRVLYNYYFTSCRHIFHSALWHVRSCFEAQADFITKELFIDQQRADARMESTS
jgi:hypothetical protein